MPPEVAYKPIEKIKKIYEGGTIQPPKFMPSFFEFLAEHGQFLIKTAYNTLGSGTTGLYTVPESHTFYI
jgi:hypothetical protein